MYTIYLMPDGTCQCEGKIQDGTERWKAPNLDAAIKHMRRFAKTMNGVNIKKKDIECLRQQLVHELQWVRFMP